MPEGGYRLCLLEQAGRHHALHLLTAIIHVHYHSHQ
jgi:hypothetical protein